MNAQCTIDDCGNPHAARGYCQAHYRRLQRHGDPLGGGISRGETARYAREVVMAYEGDECLKWPYGSDGFGRGSIMINKKHIRASRYVCLMTHGEPPQPNMHAAHSCGNGHLGCVNKRHIRWATPAENSNDKHQHGTILKGEDNPMVKLTRDEAVAIHSTPVADATNSELAKRYGVSSETIRRVRAGTSWAWLLNAGSSALAATEGSADV